MFTKTCPQCGTDFHVKFRCKLKTRKFCSSSCSAKSLIKSLPPEKQPAWKGGRIVGSHGYVMVRTSNKPGALAYELEHRLIMERKLGRKLREYENVHHINGVKTDNREENLVVLLDADHTRHHQKERGREIHFQKPCSQCGNRFMPRTKKQRFCSLPCYRKSSDWPPRSSSACLP